MSGIALIATGALAQASLTFGYLCRRVFALRRDLVRQLQPSDLDMATAAYDEEVTGLRCGSNPENLCLEPTRIPPARLAIAAKRPADWPLRGSGRQIKSEDRVLASRTVGKARSWGSGS